MRKGIVALALLLVAGCQRADQAVLPEQLFDLQFQLSTNRITVGDMVSAELILVHPPGTRFEVPEPMPAGSPWVIRDRRAFSQALDEDRTRTVYRYSLTSFQLGEHEWPAGEVRFLVPTGEPLERALPSLTLHVVSVLSEEDQGLSPIKPLMEWPERLPRWIPVLMGIGLLAMVLAWVAAHFLRRHRAGDFAPPPPQPHEVALQALTKLKEKGWIESRAVEPFYLEVSDIVRRYLEDRFHLRAPESTTEEFIRDAVQSRLLMREHQDLVEQFLLQCDLVKFARAQPGSAEMNEAFSAAWRLVEETKSATEVPT